MNFKEDNVVKVRKRNGDLLTGTWTTRVTDHGALIKLEFETLVDFTLEWFVYDLEPGKIKLYQEGGNKIILKKNCDIVDITKERIANYLQECLWRIARLSIEGTDKENDYIGTPFKFFENKMKATNIPLIRYLIQNYVRNASIIIWTEKRFIYKNIWVSCKVW